MIGEFVIGFRYWLTCKAFVANREVSPNGHPEIRASDSRCQVPPRIGQCFCITESLLNRQVRQVIMVTGDGGTGTLYEMVYHMAYLTSGG